LAALPEMQAPDGELIPIKIEALNELIGRDVSEGAVGSGPVYENDGAVGGDKFFDFVQKVF
jgi:hypothetical protein